MLSKVRCPNPEHEDVNPSCVLYHDSAYCYSRCGHISKAQWKEWTGGSFDDIPRESLRQPRDTHPVASRQNTTALVSFWSRTLLEGPRRSRIAWYHQRGFSERACSRWKFGHTGTHFSIPLWNSDDIVGYKLRRDENYCDPDEPKYINQRGLGSVIVRPNPTGLPRTIVEGELDAYLLSTFGVDAITVSTGIRSIQSLSQLVRSLPDVYIIPDNDNEGIRGANDLAQTAPAKFHTLRLPDGFGDVTDYLVSFEPDERAAALRSLFNARPNTPEIGR